MRKKRSLKIFISFLVAALFMQTALWRCASVGAPQGGPRDSLPPRIILMSPEYGTRNFKEKRIFVTFDEYVQIKDQQKEFFTSPQMKKNPTISIRGRGIQIDIADTLLENQTYSLNFGNSLRDNNEGNPLSDFRYVFSTGPAIDSMLMSGYVVDGYTSDSVSRAFVFFYPAGADTIPGKDSLLFRKPAAVARAKGNGLFVAENLKPIDYRIYVLDDKNGNMSYEPGVDRVAFLDSVFNPTNMPGFTIRYDTIRRYNVPDPQLYFRTFMDEGSRRQSLSSSKRPLQHRVDMVFAAKNPVIEKLQLEGIDSTQIIVQYHKPTKDSLSLWLHVPAEALPDTLKGEITYLRHDSLNVLQSYTQQLSLLWRAPAASNKDKDKDKNKGQNDTLQGPEPLPLKADASSALNPFKNIPFTFEAPIVSIDSAAISLSYEDKDKKQRPAKFHFTRDSVNMMRWILSSDWVPEAKYNLLIPPGAMEDVAGLKNDSLQASFTVQPKEKFAEFVLEIIGKTPESHYVVQLLDGSNKLLRSIPYVRSGKLIISYIDPGKVRLRVVEDMNGNGKWDDGKLIERLQPERTELFLLSDGADIEAKENWTYPYTLDMNVMFAPVTMQTMMEQLRKLEQERQLKALKAREDQQRSNSQSGSSGMGFGGMGSGGAMSLPGGGRR